MRLARSRGCQESEKDGGKDSIIHPSWSHLEYNPPEGHGSSRVKYPRFSVTTSINGLRTHNFAKEGTLLCMQHPLLAGFAPGQGCRAGLGRDRVSQDSLLREVSRARVLTWCEYQKRVIDGSLLLLDFWCN